MKSMKSFAIAIAGLGTLGINGVLAAPSSAPKSALGEHAPSQALASHDATNTSKDALLQKKLPQKRKGALSGKLGRKTVADARRDQGGAQQLQQRAIPSAPSVTSTPSSAGSSTAQVPSAKRKRALDKFSAAVFFEFFGPSVSDPFSGYMPDTSTGYSQGNVAQELGTYINLGYRLNNRLLLIASPYFVTRGQSADGSDSSKFMSFDGSNSSIRLLSSRFAKSGNLTWNGDFRIYPGGLGEPTKNRRAYLRTGQNLVYSVSPRLTFAAYNTLRYYNFSSDHFANGQNMTTFNLRATFSPAVEYRFSDMFTGSLSYNMDVRHQQKTGKIVSASPYFEAAGIISTAKWLFLNPFIDVYPKHANIEAWQLGANVMFTIL
jgi:hypothetical protein